MSLEQHVANTEITTLQLELLCTSTVELRVLEDKFSHFIVPSTDNALGWLCPLTLQKGICVLRRYLETSGVHVTLGQYALTLS